MTDRISFKSAGAVPPRAAKQHQPAPLVLTAIMDGSVDPADILDLIRNIAGTSDTWLHSAAVGVGPLRRAVEEFRAEARALLEKIEPPR